jgi:hypothetical protein
MQLQSLNMYRYGSSPMTGTIQFADKDNNEIKLKLDEPTCHRLLLVVADQLVETSKEQAAALTANIIEHTGQVLLK